MDNKKKRTFKIATEPWLRRWKAFLKHNRTIKLPGYLGGLTIPVSIDGVPPTRSGYDRSDTERPFYESRPDRLFSFYNAYSHGRMRKYNIVYTDILGITAGNFNPIFDKNVRIDDFNIEFLPVPYRIPMHLRGHAEDSVRIFQELGRLYRKKDDRWENNECLSVSSLSNDGNLKLRRAKYSDQIGTNITLDWASGHILDGGTIRNDIEGNPNGSLPPFEASALANTIGTAIQVFTRDMRPIFRVRNPNLAAIPFAGVHPSASGVLEPPVDLEAGNFAFDIFVPGTQLEIKREMGLTPEEYDLYPIAFARELPRGGKPQLFWIAVVKIETAELERRLLGAPEKNEFLDRSSFDLIGNEEKEFEDYSDIAESFTYEGLASFTFAQDFVTANANKLGS